MAHDERRDGRWGAPGGSAQLTQRANRAGRPPMRARLLTPTRRARLVRAWREGLPAPWDALLAAATLGYRAALAVRGAGYAAGILRAGRLPCRVVAVGNLTVGGTGKTPLVEWLARELSARGRRVVVLSRGYGRRGAAGVRVVSDGERVLIPVAQAGDEPYLLGRRLRGVPVVVGRDRHRAGAAALARFGPDVLLLDDGFQQRRLRADVSVVCLDARAPWGRRGLLPRGTLREPPSALGRAGLLVVTHAAGVDAPGLDAELRALAPSAAVAHARYEPEGLEDVRSGRAAPVAALSEAPFVAFAGIAVPEHFAVTLAALGHTPREFVAFPDHHPYTACDVSALEAQARAVGATTLVTTEKDGVRFPATGALPAWVLRVRLRLEDRDGAWWRALERALDLP